MSKSNIQRVIEEILSDERRLPKFLACEDQDELYRYCLERSSGYTREEFDEFIEETISKANLVSENKELNQNSLLDGGAEASFGKKIRQAFTKVLAAGLAVFSVAPVVQNLIPSTAQAAHTDIKNHEATRTDVKESNERNNKNKGKSKSRPRASSPLKPVINWLKKDSLRIGTLFTGTTSIILGGKLLWDYTHKDKKALEIITPIMDSNQLKENIKKFIPLLESCIIKNKDDEKFKAIPYKARFSKSEEAEQLVAEIKSKININNDLVYADALEFQNKALEILNYVNTEKQPWYGIRDYHYDKPHPKTIDYTFENHSYKVFTESLEAKFKENDIVIKSFISNTVNAVFEAEDINGEKHFLIKLFHNDASAKEEIKTLVFSGCNCEKNPILLTFVDGTVDEKETTFNFHVVVSELLPGRNALDFVEDKLKKTNDTSQKEKLLLKIMRSWAEELDNFHKEKNCIHGDVKPENVIVSELDDEIKTKLIDFGGNIRTIDSQTEMKTCCFSHISPEAINDRNLVATSQDVWALGCAIYRLLTNENKFHFFFDDERKFDEDLQIAAGNIDEYDDWETKNNKEHTGTEATQPGDLNELIERCLIKNPEHRATMKQIIDWCEHLLANLSD